MTGVSDVRWGDFVSSVFVNADVHVDVDVQNIIFTQNIDPCKSYQHKCLESAAMECWNNTTHCHDYHDYGPVTRVSWTPFFGEPPPQKMPVPMALLRRLGLVNWMYQVRIPVGLDIVIMVVHIQCSKLFKGPECTVLPMVLCTIKNP